MPTRRIRYSTRAAALVSSNASEALTSLAEFLQSPVLMTAEGKGAVSDRHYLSLGGMNFRNDPYMKRMPDHDLVVLVGTTQRLSGLPIPEGHTDRR